MPKHPNIKTQSRKAKQRKREHVKRSAAVSSKPVSKAPSRLVSYFRKGGNLAKQHLVITCAIGACLMLGLVIWGMVAWFTAPEIGPEVGNRAPDFTLQTVDGNSVSLRDLKGKIVILDFWEMEPSRCSPTRNPLEDGSRLSRELQEALNRWPDKKLAIFAIAPLADNAEGKELANKLGITFPIGLDPSRKTYSDYHIAYDPTRIFIDQGGVIRAIMPGPALGIDELETVLRDIQRHRKGESMRPVISNILVSSIADKKAVIEFTTDKPAVGWVILDNTDSAPCTTPEATATTNHSIILASLQPTTTYYFRVLASYESKLESPYLSQRGSFTTLVDTLPPAISSVTVSDITDSSATISWSTDEPAVGQLEYGTTGASNQMIKLEQTATASHSTNLATLDADTTYQFTIMARDTSGNEATTNSSFTTLSSSLSSGPAVVGSPAPNFTLPTLDGKAISLSDYRGKTVIVHFWTVLCRVCKAEMPLIQDFYNTSQHDDGLVLVAIAFKDSAETVREFVDSSGITFPVLLDSEGKADAKYQSPVFPCTYFIDSNGIIKNIKEARFHSVNEIEEILKSL